MFTYDDVAPTRSALSRPSPLYAKKMIRNSVSMICTRLPLGRLATVVTSRAVCMTTMTIRKLRSSKKPSQPVANELNINIHKEI